MPTKFNRKILYTQDFPENVTLNPLTVVYSTSVTAF